MPLTETQWQPTRHEDGRYQLSVVYEHANGRFVSDAVGIRRYMHLYEKGLLKWQQRGLPRPEYNPPLEIAKALLEDEKSYLEQKALSVYHPSVEQPRKRLAVLELPPEPEPEAVSAPSTSTADRIAHMRKVMQAARDKKKPAALIDRYRQAASVLLSQDKELTAENLAPLVDLKVARVKLFLEFNADFAQGVVPAEPSEESAVDHYAENMRLAFSARDLEIVDDYLDGKIPRGLSRNSVQSRLSGLCTKAGIPALGNRGQFFQRVALLKAAREHMKSRVKRRAGE